MDQGIHSFIDSVAQESHLRVETDLGDGFVRLRTEEAQRRQAQQDIRSSEDILIELLRNARDAHAHLIFVALSKTENERCIVMIDDGCGIPTALHDAVFEARVTSKLDTFHEDKWGVHGRGMALYSIRHNAQEATIISSQVGQGTALRVRTSLDMLGEKTDQSSMPELIFDTEQNLTVKGPKNLNRTLVEFALAEQGVCTIFVGSQVEIAASLYAFGVASTPTASRIFTSTIGDIALVKRLAFATDPDDFVSIAQDLGLSLSSRSARRIMDGSIKARPSLLETLEFHYPHKVTRRNEKSLNFLAERRSLKINDRDLHAFRSDLKNAWSELAEAYYLDPSVEPEVRVSNKGVTVVFPVRHSS